MGSHDVLEELRAALAGLEAGRAENERLRRENGRLHRRIAELEEQVAGLQRAGKRQAAPFARRAPRSDPRPPGRRPGDRGHHRHREAPDQIDETVVAGLPPWCPGCGGELEDPDWVEQIQEELPIVRPRVTKFEIPIARCRTCGKRVQGRHPQQTSDAIAAASVQLGPRALALAASLHKELGLSLQKTARVLKDVAGITITRGGLCQALARLGTRCVPTYDALCRVGREAAVGSMDETGWRVNGRSAWLWVLVTASVTVYAIRRGRGFEDAAQLLGEGFTGVLVRDGWAPYRRFVQAEHQTCLAHIGRRCHEMLEVAHGRAREIPRAVARIVEVALWLREAHDHQEIDEPEFELVRHALEIRLDALLTRPTIGKPANRRLLAHLQRERESLFTFLRRPGVPATNWQAEQGLRPAVVNRKTWGGNRTWAGAATQERLMTILRSCRQQALDPIHELADLLRQPQPALLPHLTLSGLGDRGG